MYKHVLDIKINIYKNENINNDDILQKKIIK